MHADRSEARMLVLERTRELVVALKATPAGERLIAAEQRFRADPEIQQIHGMLREREEALRQAQEAGTPTQTQIRALREVQARHREHQLVREVELARMPFEILLRDVNGAMANVLDLDVGRIVGPAGGAVPGSGRGS